MKKILFGILLMALTLLFYSCNTFPKKWMGMEEQRSYTIALRDGNLEKVKQYYKEYGKNYVLYNYGFEGAWEYNALEVALLGHSYEVADFLIEKGADVNGISPSGKNNIIFTFVYLEDIEAVKYLMEKGACVKGLTPPITTLIAYSNNIEFIKLINNKDFDIEEKDESGYSALFVASGNGNLEAVKHLLNLGADVNILNNTNDTPLIIALGQNHVDVAEYLIENNADISIKDKEGLDALWFANELEIKVKGLNY